MTRFRPRNNRRTNRRTLLKGAVGAVAASYLVDAASVFGAPASERIRLALVGCGGRGSALGPGFTEQPNCQVVYACDPNRPRAESAARTLSQLQPGVECRPLDDFRRALDDPQVDAIVSATPDHWHALTTVWACQAGKDVYVEKPACHSPWEGQQMVAAARRYDRVVQVGTQSRSAPYAMEAKRYIEQGKLGKIHFCRILNQKGMPNFPWEPDRPAPPGLNWDMWNGPAPECPYNPTYHHHWHHFWRYSGGDAVNDSIHQVDLARWLLGVELPKTVRSVGGRFHSEGAAETPDTQITTYEFDDLVVSFELTLYTPYMLKIDPEVRNSDMFPLWSQCATRIEIYGSEGVMVVGRHGGGWQVFDRPKNREPVVKAQAYGRFPDPEHKANFLACMRSRQRPNADIQIGHRSTLLVLYANISYRLGGRVLHIDPETETFRDDDEAMTLFRRAYREPYRVPDVRNA
ncbi:Gfo/Idh/MocA family oxidoreductase [Thermostilla marina]